jgi:glycosyltransferase involved in cell wall biosynthesis
MTMPISGATMAAMRDRAGTSPPAQVIPLGLNPLPPPSASATEEFARLLGISPTRPVLLTVGRLVERKGVAWFVGAVLPLLPDGAIYAVVGEGPQRDAIAAAAAAGGVAHRVCMLGRVSDDLLGAAYARADIFVMPNIPVTGDMEGFGLVALEAAASGLPVVASDLEGITEALQNGRNGVLVPPGDGAAYARELTALLAMPSEERRVVGTSAAVCTQERYGWDRTARGYVRAMQLVVGAGRDNNVAGTPVES